MTDGLREIAEQLCQVPSSRSRGKIWYWPDGSYDHAREIVERAMRLMAEAVARWHGHIPTEEDMADYAEQAEELLKAEARK